MAGRSCSVSRSQQTSACPEAEYHRQARFVLIRREEKELAGKIVVVTAGTADIPVAEEAAIVAELTGNVVERLYDVGVSGMRRVMSRTEVFLGANVVVVVAGMEGALPSIVGGMVECPVIASSGGLRPVITDPLPSGIAGVLSSRFECVEVTVEAALEGDRDKFVQALLIDGAVTSIETAYRMADELLAAQKEYLPQF